MSEFNKISELIQKFGLISGKKQIFKTIQSFLGGFEKASLAASVTSEPNGRFLVAINSRGRLTEDVFVSLTQALEPFILKYFVNDRSIVSDSISISGLIDFEHYGSGLEQAAAYNSKKKAELKGSLILPVFIESKVYSVFAIFSEDEFSLTQQELLSFNILAHMTALALKTLAVNQKMQKLIGDLKLEKSQVVEKACRITKILDLSHSLVSVDSYENLLGVTLNAYCSVFNVEQAMILGINHHKKELYVETCRGFNEDFAANFKLPCGYGLIGSVIEKNEPYFRKNLFDSDEELAVIPFNGVSGIVCGAIVLYDKFNRLSYGDDEYELMWMLANFFSLSLNLIKVRSVNETFEKKAEEIITAADPAQIKPSVLDLHPSDGVTEKTFAPAEFFNECAGSIKKILSPSLKIETPKITLSCGYMQSESLGCDLIDVFKAENNSIIAAAADVSGRGINAAMTAAMLRAQIRAVCRYNGELRTVMSELNNLVCEDIDTYNFITLFLMQISPSGGRAAFSNAGHCPVIHYIKDGDSAVVHESRNSPLGVMRNSDFKEGILLLNSGDILLIYTDGLVEAKNSAGEAFGRARLCEIIKSSSRGGAEEIKEAIISQFTSHMAGEDLEDDIAFIAVKVG